MKKKKKVWKDYFSFRIYMAPADLEAFTALAMGKDKTILSRTVFELVRRNMPGLSGASLAPPKPRSDKRAVRRLILASMPEYKDVMAFIRANLRATSFKQSLAALILYGEVPEAESGELAQPVASPVRQAAGPGARPSPRALFDDPSEAIAKAIVLDLAHWKTKPVLEQALFDWLTVPPSEYPEDVKKYPAFATLQGFWEHHHNRAKG